MARSEKILAAFSAALFCGVVISSRATDYSAWKYHQTLTITPGPAVTEAVTDLPVLVTLTSGNASSVFAHSRADGFDVRFANAAGTADLAFQRQSFNQAARSAEFWVRVPTIAANPATTAIRMYWGNASATDVQGSKSVFDTATGYRAVWHMGAAVGANEPDATGSGHELVPTASPAAAAGPVGAGAAKNFDGATQHCIAKNSGGTGSTLSFPFGGPMTISAWVNPATEPTCKQILGKGNMGTCATWTGSYGWYYSGSTAGQLRFDDKGDFSMGIISRCIYAVAPSTWTHLVWVRNGTGSNLACNNVYVNGVSAGQTVGISTYSGTRVDTLPFTIGADSPLAGTISEHWNGAIQEVEISSGPWSASRIGLAYQNQKAGSSLIAFGPVGVRPGAALLPGSRLQLAQKGWSLEYALPRSGEVRISLLDLRGKTVLDLSRSEEAGSHMLRLGRTSLPAGAYLACVRSSGLETRMLVNLVR